METDQSEQSEKEAKDEMHIEANDWMSNSKEDANRDRVTTQKI